VTVQCLLQWRHSFQQLRGNGASMRALVAHRRPGLTVPAMLVATTTGAWRHLALTHRRNTSARPTAWLGISDSNFDVQSENSSL
jgi:hypothetical protein